MKNVIIMLFLMLIVVTSALAGEKTSKAIDFKGTTLNGKEIKLSDFIGKVVILDFWASWCGPCRKEFPFLIDLYRKNMENDVVVVAVNLDENPADMKKFLSRLKTKVPFPIIADKSGKLPVIYKVDAMPTTLFIDKKGFIRFRHTGFKDAHKQKYKNELSVLVGED